MEPSIILPQGNIKTLTFCRSGGGIGRSAPALAPYAPSTQHELRPVIPNPRLFRG